VKYAVIISLNFRMPRNNMIKNLLRKPNPHSPHLKLPAVIKLLENTRMHENQTKTYNKDINLLFFTLTVWSPD